MSVNARPGFSCGWQGICVAVGELCAKEVVTGIDNESWKSWNNADKVA